MTTARWWLLPAAGAAAVVAYPPAVTAGFGSHVYLLGTLLLVASLLVGARWQPPGRRHPWCLLAAGFLCWAAADAVFVVHAVRGREVPFPSVADIAYLCGYPLLTAGAAALVRLRTPGRDWTGLIDASILATGAGVVAWVFVIGPSGAGLPPLGRAAATAYPVLDLALLWVVSRLAIGGGRRSPAFALLLTGLALIASTHLLYGWLQVQGRYEVGGLIDAGWMVAFALIGAAALHPTADRLTERADVGEQRVGTGRLVALAVASLLAPAIGLLHAHDGLGRVASGASIVLFLLVVLRMGGLLRALERAKAQVEELQRRREERRFRSLVQHAADILIVIDRDGRVSFASPSAVRLLGDDPTGWDADRLTATLDPAVAGALVAHFAVLDQGRGAAPVAVPFRQPDGRVRRLELVVTDLRSDPDVQGLVLNGRDVTERDELEGRLRHLAFHDPLTGLANRSLFGDRVAHALDRARRTGAPVAVLFCDLDDFKTVNDGLGHEAGDRVLRVVAERLERTLRTGDTAARLGGDEFGVLVEDLDGDTQAELVAERILEAMRASVVVDGREVRVGASIGLALWTGEEDAERLLRNADVAMYHAKAAGHDAWRRFEPAMHTEALERLNLVGALSTALERGELSLAYQPVVELDSGAIVGAEALLRWDHPERGAIPPDQFIPLAEHSGQIVELGRWVLHEACRQARRWQDGRDAQPLRVSVNVSARQLQDPGLVETVTGALDASGLEPSCLILELTETVLLRDPQQALATLTALRGLGVLIAIDDFGTGYSSLSYLQRLPVDIIKIDKSFVDDLGHGDPGASLARGILDLTRTLAVTALAEGIETPAQAEELRAMSCALGQGFHFWRAVDPAEFRRLLARDGHPAAVR